MSIDYAQPERDDIEPEADAVVSGHEDVSSLRPLPRISVHAFCETPSLLELMENCAEDRRLLNVNMRINQGSILAAASMFETSPTPNLLVIESSLDRSGLMDELQKLASVCDRDTHVVVIGNNNDIGLYRELMRNGIAEYMVKPVSMADVIDTMASIFVDPEAEPVGKTVAFFGAKGGVGASTLAHNCGWGISNLFSSGVILADLDLAYGTANLNFDCDPLQGMAEALFSQTRIDDVYMDRLLEKCSEHMSLLAAPSMMDKTFDIDEDAFLPVIEILQRSAPITIFDVPHVWNAWTHKLLAAVDTVVVCATPDLANLRNAKNIFDVLGKARPNDPIPHLILNQVGMPKRPEISVSDFCDPFDVDPLAVVPFDAALFGNAANSGRMISEMEPKSPTAETISQISHILTGRTEVKKQKTSPLAGLLSKLGK
ncbi:CpaE family protein [Lentilitoribacter sp. Alg239-R112]|uniref:AAA family ATPase n=1 Tax=Lentilitoribacter sp. Alg239-R112 TaxID=2305987 RepID=UPI0013A6FD56|nr:CpaE family protein [Lentilitoribacter sp. Alg239-R112]